MSLTNSAIPRALGALVVSITLACVSAGPSKAAAALPQPAEAVPTPTVTGWAVIQHPAPRGQEDFPLRGVWVNGKEIWAVGHAYADLFWKPWGIRCVQLVCTPLNLAGIDDSAVATAAAIDGTSPSDVWVVGRQLIKHFNGTTWDPVEAAVLGPVMWSDVDAVSPTDAWAVGTVQGAGTPRAVVAHWDGTAWTEDTAALPATCGEGPEPQVVALAGQIQVSATCDGRGTVLVRDRLIWRTVLDTPDRINGLDLVAGVVWATGSTGLLEPRVWREKGGTWQTGTAPTGVVGSIMAMAGPTRDNRWVVGAVPFGPERDWFVSHWDGRAWTSAAQPGDTVMPILYDVVIDPEGRPWTVGGETNGCPHPNCGDTSLLLRGPSRPVGSSPALRRRASRT